MSLGLARSTTWRRAPVAGIALAIALAATAKLGAVAISQLGQGAGVPVSAIVLAVLLGIAWRNTFGVSSRFEPGVQIVAQRVLRFGIALVGLRLTLAGMAAVGPVAITVAVGCLLTALATATLLGRLLGLPRAFCNSARARHGGLRLHGRGCGRAGASRPAGRHGRRADLRRPARKHGDASLSMARRCALPRQRYSRRHVPRYRDPRHLAGHGRGDDLCAAVCRPGRGGGRGLHEAAPKPVDAGAHPAGRVLDARFGERLDGHR